MGVKVREKPPGSGVFWVFISHFFGRRGAGDYMVFQKWQNSGKIMGQVSQFFICWSRKANTDKGSEGEWTVNPEYKRAHGIDFREPLILLVPGAGIEPA